VRLVLQLMRSVVAQATFARPPNPLRDTAPGVILCRSRVLPAKYAPRLPRHLTPDQVETLIAAVRTNTAMGRRNYAVMLLLARLGLRAAEVIAIRIDDIDWRAIGC
jgi:integrase/recombinase XerD